MLSDSALHFYIVEVVSVVRDCKLLGILLNTGGSLSNKSISRLGFASRYVALWHGHAAKIIKDKSVVAIILFIYLPRRLSGKTVYTIYILVLVAPDVLIPNKLLRNLGPNHRHGTSRSEKALTDTLSIF